MPSQENPKHPNAATDPDCTNVQALEEALQSRIAAELYHLIVTALRNTESPAYQSLLDQITIWEAELQTKYTRLRTLIGLTGETKDAT